MKITSVCVFLQTFVSYIVTCGLSSSTIFVTFSQEEHGFWKTLLNIQNVLWYCLTLLSGTYLILRKIQQDYHKSTQIFIWSQILIKPEHSWDFLKVLKHRISWKCIQLEQVFHAERETDMVKLTVAFQNFAHTPKNRTWRSFMIFTPNQIQGKEVKQSRYRPRVAQRVPGS